MLHKIDINKVFDRSHHIHCVGGVTLIWVATWLLFVTDSPKTHPFISHKERNFIRGERHDHVSDMVSAALKWPQIYVFCKLFIIKYLLWFLQSKDNSVKTPWLLILRSGPVWAMIAAMVSVASGMSLVFSYLPKYMDDVYHLNTREVHFRNTEL